MERGGGADLVVFKGVLCVDEKGVEERDWDEEEHGDEIHRSTHHTETLGTGGTGGGLQINMLKDACCMPEYEAGRSLINMYDVCMYALCMSEVR